MKKLWDHYASAWSTPDEKKRISILEKHLAPSVVYTDPETQATGYQELSDYMAQFQEGFPGRRFVVSKVIVHHGRCLAWWTMQTEKGEIDAEGASFAEIGQDGRLSRIFGFFGEEAV